MDDTLKRSLLICTLALALLTSGGIWDTSESQVLCPGQDQVLRPVGFQQLTVSTTAVGLTLPSLTASASTELAIVYVDAQPIRYRTDGTDPTTSVGAIANDTDILVVCRESLSLIRFIRDGGVDATLEIHYYGL